MSLWRIAWSYLWNRKLTTVMTIISVALGAGLISTVLTLREETQRRFEEEGQAFDLVIGAKGNPLQLVLSTSAAIIRNARKIRLRMFLVSPIVPKYSSSFDHYNRFFPARQDVILQFTFYSRVRRY